MVQSGTSSEKRHQRRVPGFCKLPPFFRSQTFVCFCVLGSSQSAVGSGLSDRVFCTVQKSAFQFFTAIRVYEVLLFFLMNELTSLIAVWTDVLSSASVWAMRTELLGVRLMVLTTSIFCFCVVIVTTSLQGRDSCDILG